LKVELLQPESFCAEETSAAADVLVTDLSVAALSSPTIGQTLGVAVVADLSDCTETSRYIRSLVYAAHKMWLEKQ
jgi:hypothetical protein